MKLELAVLAGSESKAFLVGLTKQIDRLEKISKGLTGSTEIRDASEEDDEDEDFSSKPAKKKSASFEEDEETEETEETEESEEDEETDEEEETEETDEDEDEPAPVQTKKGRGRPKKLTVDDVNDACKTKAASIGGKEGRTAVLTILKKKFKTQSVSELKPDQYQACIEAMAVEE
jgi:hypothetical protein